jgi:hypothetical protein
MKTAATLKGRLGTLRFTVLGYEYPDAESPEDRNWLAARVEWESESSKASHEGAILQTHELRALAGALSDENSYGEHAFLEPSVALRRSRAESSVPERVTITLFGEARHGEGRFEVTTPVDPADVLAFGEGLRRIAEQFPARQARPGLAAA